MIQFCYVYPNRKKELYHVLLNWYLRFHRPQNQIDYISLITIRDKMNNIICRRNKKCLNVSKLIILCSTFYNCNKLRCLNHIFWYQNLLNSHSLQTIQIFCYNYKILSINLLQLNLNFKIFVRIFHYYECYLDKFLKYVL